jgi:tetratricopeptide (TPR) repeat protein
MPIEGRIESGYFRQDAPALQALAAMLSSGQRSGQRSGQSSGQRSDDSRAASGGQDREWRSYYAALVAYRLALLAKSDAVRASPLAQRCIDRLNQALVLAPQSAEALALQSACLALQSRLDSWRSPLSAPLSLARIDKALELAPNNPRVLLLGALAANDRPTLFGGDPQQAFTLLQRAVSAFEQRRGRPPELPGWGAAEAFTALALEYLTRGDTIAARNVLERALLVAPDFAQARSLMAKIVSG